MLHIPNMKIPRWAKMERINEPAARYAIEREALNWVEAMGPEDWLLIPGFGYVCYLTSVKGFDDSDNGLNEYERQFLSEAQGFIVLQIDGADGSSVDGGSVFEWYNTVEEAQARWTRIHKALYAMSEFAAYNEPSDPRLQEKARWNKLVQAAQNLNNLPLRDAQEAILEALTYADTLREYADYLDDDGREGDAESIRQEAAFVGE